MPWIAFVDEKLQKELSKIKGNANQKEIFPEHEFLASCLRIGLCVSDLEKLTYVDVMKVLVTFIQDESTKNSREATQSDIDRLLG